MLEHSKVNLVEDRIRYKRAATPTVDFCVRQPSPCTFSAAPPQVCEVRARFDTARQDAAKRLMRDNGHAYIQNNSTRYTTTQRTARGGRGGGGGGGGVHKLTEPLRYMCGCEAHMVVSKGLGTGTEAMKKKESRHERKAAEPAHCACEVHNTHGSKATKKGVRVSWSHLGVRTRAHTTTSLPPLAPAAWEPSWVCCGCGCGRGCGDTFAEPGVRKRPS